MRWKLMLSFVFGFAPVLIAAEGFREGASMGSTLLVTGFFYPICIMLCMVFAQEDGMEPKVDATKEGK